MKNSILVSLALLFASQIHAQDKLSTRTGKVTFSSETTIENIHAENNQTASIFLLDQNQIAFNVLLKSFKFDKALMEEHFNEKYVHSDKYPAAKFKGTLSEKIDINTPKEYTDVPIDGEMIFHGITKQLKVLANITVNKDKTISLSSKFNLNLEEYHVEVPSLVEDKIADDIMVSIVADYH